MVTKMMALLMQLRLKMRGQHFRPRSPNQSQAQLLLNPLVEVLPMVSLGPVGLGVPTTTCWILQIMMQE